MRLYEVQKGIPETFILLFKIKEVLKYDKLWKLVNDDEQVFTYFYREKDKISPNKHWTQNFKKGNIISVFCRKVIKGENIYFNIYPNITQLEPLIEDDIN